MEFTPDNTIVKICLGGIALEAKGDLATAMIKFQEAWDAAANDFEKCIAAYFVATHQKNAQAKLNWFQIALQAAMTVNNDVLTSALPTFYENIANCYEALHDEENTQTYRTLANGLKGKIFDSGPFYHGTKADLEVGDALTAGYHSNYKSELVMNHIYFTAMANGAGLAAALAKGEGAERVYVVEPTGPFEHDPNVTDKKFPGNLTRSYRTQMPLKIIGERTEWIKQSAAAVQQWKEKLANNKGEIIN